MALLCSSNGYCFAHEYNSKNGTTDKDGNTYLSLNIKTDNPFIVQTDEEILSDIENGYTGYVYFGYPTCPYCRNTVPVLIGVLKENGVSKVLYCNLKKYNYQFEYSSESGIVETQHGTDDYDSLLNILSGTQFPKPSKIQTVTAWIQVKRRYMFRQLSNSMTAFRYLAGSIRMQD